MKVTKCDKCGKELNLLHSQFKFDSFVKTMVEDEYGCDRIEEKRCSSGVICAMIVRKKCLIGF